MPGHIHITEAVGKILGKAKVAKGALEGLSGIFITLMEEHGQVSALLKRVKKSSDPGERRELFATIREQLILHEESELAVLYPACREHPELAAIADQHDLHAHRIELAVERLYRRDTRDPDWGAEFDQLAALVHSHVQDEENNYFPTAYRLIGQNAKALDEALYQKKQELVRKHS